MDTYTNIYTQKIYDILAPLVGGIMAKGILKSQLTNKGINEENLTKENLAKLADDIKKGLVIFIGSDSAEKVASNIKQI